MGVYIKGIEMPTKGYRLILIHADGTVQSTDGETTAVHVPPHGRLINADALMDIYNDRQNKIIDRYGFDSSENGILAGAMKLLSVQSTIIEAEEEA